MTNKDAIEALERVYEQAWQRLSQIETQMNALGQASPSAIADIRLALQAQRKALENTITVEELESFKKNVESVPELLEGNHRLSIGEACCAIQNCLGFNAAIDTIIERAR